VSATVAFASRGGHCASEGPAPHGRCEPVTRFVVSGKRLPVDPMRKNPGLRLKLDGHSFVDLRRVTATPAELVGPNTQRDRLLPSFAVVGARRFGKRRAIIWRSQTHASARERPLLNVKRGADVQ